MKKQDKLCKTLYVSKYLRIQGEGIETHWADESYVSSLGVEHVIIGSNPQTSMLGQHLYNLEGLEVIYKDVWKPQLIDQLQIDRDHGVWRSGVQLLKKALGYMQAGLLPQDVEIRAESHRIFLKKMKTKVL